MSSLAPAAKRYLQEKLTALQAQRAQIERDIAALERALEIADADVSADDQVSATKMVPNAIWSLLRETGQPLHYTVILERLQRRGVTVRGQDPAKNVGAHMSGDPRFVSNGKGFWGLKSWENAESSPAGNVPSRDAQDSPPVTSFTQFRPAVKVVGGGYIPRDDDDLEDLPF